MKNKKILQRKFEKACEERVKNQKKYFFGKNYFFAKKSFFEKI